MIAHSACHCEYCARRGMVIAVLVIASSVALGLLFLAAVLP